MEEVGKRKINFIYNSWENIMTFDIFLYLIKVLMKITVGSVRCL